AAHHRDQGGRGDGGAEAAAEGGDHQALPPAHGEGLSAGGAYEPERAQVAAAAEGRPRQGPGGGGGRGGAECRGHGVVGPGAQLRVEVALGGVAGGVGDPAQGGERGGRAAAHQQGGVEAGGDVAGQGRPVHGDGGEAEAPLVDGDDLGGGLRAVGQVQREPVADADVGRARQGPVDGDPAGADAVEA